jgi:hypothetical protein
MKTEQYRVEYIFNHSSHGFSNSVTVSAISSSDAKRQAENEVFLCYGSKMLKRFTLREPALLRKEPA